MTTHLAQKTGVYHPATELAEARAAVAELIEALKAWDRWNYEAQSAKVTGESVYSFQELTDMRTEAVRLTDAALARVGGAA